MPRFKTICVFFFNLIIISCADDDPNINGKTTPDGSVDNGNECGEKEVTYDEDVAECSYAATDYTPRINESADDTWAECISDDNVYHQIEESVSSISRVAAYDAIGKYLWNNSNTPTPKDFIDARVLYEEEQGIGSRVARRYDPHYKAPSTNSKCDEEGVADKYPNYCVGPAILQPIIVKAFADGSQGKALLINSAKIHAALQWFLAVSAFKEGTTCADKPKDCDSSWAYYCGGTSRETSIGIAAEINNWAPETHNRVYDGILAMRCWRHLDQQVPATNTDMQKLALKQLDTALLRGISILLRQYFLTLTCSTGNHQQAALAAIKIITPLLDRETRTRDTAAADLLKTQSTTTLDNIDVTTAIKTIDKTYPCP